MAPRNNPLSQSVISGYHFQPSSTNWNHIDNEFRSIITPIHAGLSSDSISTEEAGELFTQLLTDLLIDRGIIKEPNSRSNHGPPRERDNHSPDKPIGRTKESNKESNTPESQ
jgi:hypothetical protein